MGIGDALLERGRRLWLWFFPPRVPLPEGAGCVLRSLYPGLDLDAVSFHLGLPHFLSMAGNVAITLPALLAPRRTRIYVDPRHWRPESVEGLGTLAHEAYHALQVQEAGWGWGPFRPFLVLYLACAAANRFRYRGHPMEEDAYVLAGNRRSRFETTFAATEAAAIERDSAGLAADLVTTSSGLRFWRTLAAGPARCGRSGSRRKGCGSWEPWGLRPWGSGCCSGVSRPGSSGSPGCWSKAWGPRWRGCCGAPAAC